MRYIFGLLLFLYGFHASGYMLPAYSQTCLSPVEMAALFSKPRKKKSKTRSLGSLKKEYRKLERRIFLKENELEDIKSRLADSLKGGAGKGARIANKTEEYMSNKYDGWKCGKGKRGTQNSIPSGKDKFDLIDDPDVRRAQNSIPSGLEILADFDILKFLFSGFLDFEKESERFYKHLEKEKKKSSRHKNKTAGTGQRIFI